MIVAGALALPGSVVAAEGVSDPLAFDGALGERIPPDLTLALCDGAVPLEAEGAEGMGLVLSSPEPFVCVIDPDTSAYGARLSPGSHTLIFDYAQESLILSPITGVDSFALSAFSFASPLETLHVTLASDYVGILFEGSHTYITLEVPEGGMTLGGVSFLGADGDGDGFGHLDGAMGGDCDDDNPDIYPGAEEIPYNGRDDDCVGGDLKDVDGDGQLPFAFGGADCDDMNADVYPGAEELQDGIDNNCNGRIDEGTAAYDDDRDGFSEEEGDCDDADGAVSPEGVEIPYDGIDQDCSGADLSDVDGDGFDGGPEGDDCNDAVDYIHPGAHEYCGDGVDEDCDGEALICPTATPSSSPSPSPTPSPTPTASPTSTGSPPPPLTPSPTQTPSVFPSESPSPRVSPTPTPTPTQGAVAPLSPSPLPTVDATPRGCGDCGGGSAFLLLPFLLGVGRRGF